MGMAEVVVVGQSDRAQHDGLARGINADAGDVGAVRDQGGVMKQIVGCTVLLEDHYNVLKVLNVLCGAKLRGTASSAAVQDEEKDRGEE
jgi:hypothetical protein